MPLRDGRPLKEVVAVLEELRQRKYGAKKLQKSYDELSKDKHKAVEFFLDTKELLGYIHGLPGTGKSWSALFITCVALITPPPTTGIDDEWDLPADLGPRLKPDELDKVDMNAPLKAVQLTVEQKAALPSTTPRTKVLIATGQNTAVEDLLPRLDRMWDELPFTRDEKPVIIRLNSLETETRDFPRRFAKIGLQISASRMSQPMEFRRVS